MTNPLITEINTDLPDNTTGAITPAIMRGVLTDMVNSSILITRAQIPTTKVETDTIIVSGFTTAGDLGSGATYTSVGATSSSTMAIQDSSGTWFRLVLDNGTNVGWFGAVVNGVTDDYAALQASITALGANGGIVSVPSGTIAIGTTVSLPANVIIAGENQNSTSIKWIGATGSTAVLIPQTSSHSGLRDININCASVTGMTALYLIDSSHNDFENLTVTSAITTSGVGIRLSAGVGGTGSNFNCVFNVFEGIGITGFNIGLQFDGTPSSVVTINNFFGLEVTDSIVGIRLAQWCDTNSFYGVRVSLTSSNSFGVVFNDSATPNADTGVYNDNFYGLIVDGFGSITSCSGLFFNFTKQNQIYGFFHSPIVFPGTLINDQNSQSHIIVNNQRVAASDLIENVTKGIFRTAIFATDNSGTTYATGPSDIGMNTVVYDVASEFSSPTYTPAENCLCSFVLTLTHTSGVTANDRWLIKLVTTKRNYVWSYVVQSAAENSVDFPVLADFVIGDTAKFTIERASGSGSFPLINDGLLNRLGVSRVN